VKWNVIGFFCCTKEFLFGVIMWFIIIMSCIIIYFFSSIIAACKYLFFYKDEYAVSNSGLSFRRGIIVSKKTKNKEPTKKMVLLEITKPIFVFIKPEGIVGNQVVLLKEGCIINAYPEVFVNEKLRCKFGMVDYEGKKYYAYLGFLARSSKKVYS
jgi:hypothetical protein